MIVKLRASIYNYVTDFDLNKIKRCLYQISKRTQNFRQNS